MEAEEASQKYRGLTLQLERLSSTNMHTIALVCVCIFGCLAFGFVLAGSAMLGTPRKPNEAAEETPPIVFAMAFIAMFADLLFLGGFVSSSAAIKFNWSRNPAARKFIYAGTASALIAVGAFLILRFVPEAP